MVVFRLLTRKIVHPNFIPMKPIRFIQSILKILRGKPQIPLSLEDNPLLQTILNRRSVRRFEQRDIPEDVFHAILEAGRLAPSTVNIQPWSFAVLNAQRWEEIFGTHIPFRAPRAIIVIGDTHRTRQALDTFPNSPLVEYTIAVMNASLAAMNMNIAAEALGVSSVMLSETGRSGFFDTGYLKEKLLLPDRTVPLLTIVLGYAKGSYTPMPPKLSLDDVSFDGKYRETSHSVMEAWMAQIEDGYRAMRPFSSLNAQLRVYSSKIGQAESDLQNIVFTDITSSVKNSME
jgi:nitroreductase